MTSRVAGSFRDPKGFVFVRNGVLLRQINSNYRDDYERLMGSGLYAELNGAGLLVAHEEVAPEGDEGPEHYRTIRPDPVPLVTYPYEWCFGQLQDAALATLEIQQRAMGFGMVLKDASAYNIQFAHGKPVLIDTLSFEQYEKRPWVAYRQFCQHFLAPLALMHYRDVRLSQLLRIYIDGIPLDLASSLLPRRSLLRFSLLSHLHLHAKSQTTFGGREVSTRRATVSERSLLGLLESLRGAVERLEYGTGKRTEWGHYSGDESYTDAGLADKERLVDDYLRRLEPDVVWDLGANVGLYSRLRSAERKLTVCFDADPLAVERNYRRATESGEAGILPLVLDLTNPSPGIGWSNSERQTVAERGRADTVLALALIHHLAIANNIPLPQIATFLHGICDSLIIEFVPRDDPQVQRLLLNREDVFGDYTEENFRTAFGERFEIDESAGVAGSVRVLFRMRAKAG